MIFFGGGIFNGNLLLLDDFLASRIRASLNVKTTSKSPKRPLTA